jgi:carboxyl-terminal processing protease
MQMRTRYFALSLVAAMIAGGAITGGLLYRPGQSAAAATAAVAVQAGAEQAKFQEVYAILQSRYVSELDRNKLLEGAIDGMIKAVEDPYTTYMSPDESKKFQQHISSSFEGIGAEIREEGGFIVVASPIKGAPAERAGLKPEDRILEVNGTDLKGMKTTEAVTHIRGPKGTEARLLIQRPGIDQPFEVVIVRDTIPQNTVFLQMQDDKTAVIQISSFSTHTYEDFSAALNEAKSQGAKGILIDLRQNGGGALSAAVKIAETFVPKDELILQVKYRDGRADAYRSQGQTLVDLPVVLLVDKGSASASEIVAGALKESAGVKLVGETTYGKGSVQMTTDFNDGSSLKYTQAQWLTPKGNQINKVGIQPDVEVKLPDYADMPYPFVEREYKAGEQADPVGIVQQILKALGHDPGRTDGLIDDATVQALKAFQGVNGLQQTGTVNEETTSAAVVQLQQKIRDNDTQKAKGLEQLRELIAK